MDKLKNTWDSFWDNAKAEAKHKGSKFAIEPVTPRVFFDDWIKTPLFPRQYKAVEKAFKNNYQDLSDGINEIILAWGKRAGKDLTIANLLVYIVYWLCCLNNPQEYLKIKSGEPIDIVNVSFDKEQAKSVFFEKFVRAIKDTVNPTTKKNFYKEVFKMDLDKAILKDSITFPKNIRAWSLNSREYKGEGKNIVFAVFDEIGTFRFDKAQEIRKHIKTTAKATSSKYYKLFYISYLTSGNDYMAYLLKDTVDKKETQKGSHIYVDRAATWDVRSNKNCPENLKEFIIHKATFQDEYDEDPISAMLMYECKIPKYSANSYFKRPGRILDCIGSLSNEKDDYRHSPRIDNENLWTTEILDEEFEPWFRPHYTEKIWVLEKQYENYPSEELAKLIKFEKEKHQNAEYFIHIDLSRGIVDTAGIALGHRYRILDKTKIYIDLMLQIKATETGAEIDLSTILDYIVKYLKVQKKFPITQLTSDGWNSALFLNICTNNKIPAKLLSLEKTNAPYDTLKDFIYRVDIDFYYYPVIIRELTELMITTKKKVDHPIKSKWRLKDEGINRGSKDISDCLAGIAYTAVEDEEEEPLAFAGK